MYSVKINPNVTTRIHPDGKEIVFFKNSIPDANGRRCYCVVFTDMSLNDVMCLTPKQVFMLQITHGNNIQITDWTDFYGITPHMIENMPDTKYGVSMQCKYSYEDVLRHKISV